MLPEPVKSCLLECHVQPVLSLDRERCYFIKRTERKNVYYSSWSGGQRHYTDKDQGLAGEPIVGQVEWFIDLVGYFSTWLDVCKFLVQMRVKNIYALYDDGREVTLNDYRQLR